MDTLKILKLMAKLNTDTAILYLQVLASDMHVVDDCYETIIISCTDLLGQYRPSNDDVEPWVNVRDEIARMNVWDDDIDNGTDVNGKLKLVIIDMVENQINSNQLALLRTLAYGEQTSSYVKGAIDMYHHLGWQD